ncbi:HAD family hydrolase [Gammaproteobacteria bacterium]|nr:HAD family hydrolase [Gammaproteobacteria bacterium]
MSEACCKQHQESESHLKGMIIRSALLVAIGLLTLIPAVELLLTAGLAGYISFAGMSMFVAYVLYKDFKDQTSFNIGILLSVVLGLLSPFLPGVASIICFSVALILGAVMLFIPEQVWQYWLTKDAPKPNQYIVLPSVDKAILFLSHLSWGISLGSFFRAARGVYHFVIHDALLTLGVHNFGAWIKQRMRSKQLAYNHKSIYVTKIENGHEVQTKLTDLKKGDQFKITRKTLVPMACKVIGTTEIQDLQKEASKQVACGESLPHDVIVKSGQLECMADYQALEDKNSHQHEPDRALQFFLLAAFIIAFTGAVVAGVLFGSVIIGMQTFCYNLMVACPCAFLVAKPIIQHKFLKWLKSDTDIQFQKMPAIGKPDIMVFDRTNTLYLPPEGCAKDQPYELIEDGKSVLKDLKQQGVRVVILSGHGTGDHLAHLKACQKELKGLVAAEDIIFDQRYHNTEAHQGEKAKVIANLQNYGSVNRPKHFTQRFFKRLKRIFYPTHVAMIGDGDNDVAAMLKSDLAIAVSESKSSTVGEVLQNAHMYVENKNITQLDALVSNLARSHQYTKGFIALSVVLNLVLLALVNGLYFALFGMAFPSAAICLSTVVVCILILALTTLVKFIHHKPPSNNSCDDPCNHCSSAELDFPPTTSCHVQCCEPKPIVKINFMGRDIMSDIDPNECITIQCCEIAAVNTSEKKKFCMPAV